ncbi:MAG TPA: FecR domain-containing protein [Chryseolinea sp.]|nr:FecR domain-containing protein [Chryseolinea sp.]
MNRYTDGCSTDEERQELILLIDQLPEDHVSLKLWEELWEATKEKKSIDASKARRILHTILESDRSRVSDIKKFSWTINLRVAAVFTLLVTCFSIYYYVNSDPVGLSVSESSSLRVKQQITLPDGSLVILNEGSTLDYPPTFNNKLTREVILKGEGFFDIKHDPSKPFIVHSGKLKTTVIGTAFNISAYDSSKNITVTVARGKVKVSDDTEVIGILSMDQQLTFNTKRNTSTQQKIDSKKSTAWVEADIFFDEVTFEEAISLLEKRFNLKIKFNNDKLRTCRFTATFISGEELEHILTVICEFNNARHRKLSDGLIIIEGDGCV